ncbi:hypothetical protein ACFL6R_04865 [Gemmatimonadota bacterium]
MNQYFLAAVIMGARSSFLITLVTLLLYCGIDRTQEIDFPILQGPYLGQEPPGKTPEIFAPGIVSVERFSEFVCMFTPGARECFFDWYGDDEYPRGAVLTTRVENGKWIEPEIASLFSGFGDVFLPTMSPDGKYWFFTSFTLPVPDGVEGQIPMFYMEREESGWSTPEYLADAIHASATLDGTVYINSGREIMTGHPFNRVVDLGQLFSFDIGHPVISPDGSHLIFDSNDLPPTGDCKLFVIFQNNGSWSDPVSLGEYIKQHAFCAWITFDGDYIFFHSLDNRKGNIYWISADIIEDLKP